MDLQRFCSDDDYRPALMRPFSAGAWTYATDGHVMVRVPRVADVPENPKAPSGAAEKIFRENASPEYTVPPTIELPPVEDGEECGRCDGRGVLHDCPICNCTCRACHGTGVPAVGHDVSFGLGSAIYSARHFALIKDLPGLRFGIPDQEKPLSFKFDGGEGVLTPRSEKNSQHIELSASAAVPAE